MRFIGSILEAFGIPFRRIVIYLHGIGVLFCSIWNSELLLVDVLQWILIVV